MGSRHGSAKICRLQSFGVEVAVLVSERKSGGVHMVTVDGAGLSSGVYSDRLTAQELVQSRRMTVVDDTA